MSVDREDISQAVEIALGNRLSREMGAKRSAEQRAINNGLVLLKRILAELPPDTSVQELLEALAK